MRVKEKETSLRESVRINEASRQLIGECALRLIFGFILSRGRIFGEYAPFGCAFGASSPLSLPGAMGVLGVVLGTLTWGDMGLALKYIGILCIIRSAQHILRGAPISEGSLFSPCLTLFSGAVISLAYAIEGGLTVKSAVMVITESALMGGCAFFYRVVFTPWSNLEEGTAGRACHTASTVILVSTVIIALVPVYIFSTASIGRSLGALLILSVTYKGGCGYGSAFGACVGAACDLASGTFPLYTSLYALSSGIGGVFSGERRWIYAIMYITVNAIGVIWSWQSYGEFAPLYEMFIASVLFMLIPETILTRLEFFFPSSVTGIGYLRAREYTKGHVELAVSALKELYGAVKDFTGENESWDNPAVIYDNASEKVCRSCPRCTECWQQDYVDTVDVLNSLTPRLTEEGKLSPGDFPGRFSEKCGRLELLCDAINSEAHLLLVRRSLMVRLKDSQRTVAYQYRDMSRILETVSAELGTGVKPEPALERRLAKYLLSLNINAGCAVFRIKGGRLRCEIWGNVSALTSDEGYLEKLSELMGIRLCTPSYSEESGKLLLFEAEPISIRLGTASARRAGKRVSGDTSRAFRTDQGLFYAIISDGMGSGEEAERISQLTAGSLRKLLLSGISPSLALSLLSDVMYLKSELTPQSASIDLFELNMFTGEGKIYKCGSAPTYLKRGDIVKKISGGIFPVGLMSPGKDGVKTTSFRLRPGSWAVLISDGILSDKNDGWLSQLIASEESESPKDFSLSILKKAQELEGGSDDMTVIAIKCEERS